MGALRKVNLISVLNLSPLNRKKTLINVLKDLAYVCPVKGFRRDIVTILVNDQRDALILFYVFISIYNSLHVSSTSCSTSGETNCINTISGNNHSENR